MLHKKLVLKNEALTEATVFGKLSKPFFIDF